MNAEYGTQVGDEPTSIEEWIRTCEDADAQRLYRAVESGKPFVLVTGAAGTGKSTLLKLLAAELRAPVVNAG